MEKNDCRSFCLSSPVWPVKEREAVLLIILNDERLIKKSPFKSFVGPHPSYFFYNWPSQNFPQQLPKILLQYFFVWTLAFNKFSHFKGKIKAHRIPYLLTYIQLPAGMKGNYKPISPILPRSPNNMVLRNVLLLDARPINTLKRVLITSNHTTWTVELSVLHTFLHCLNFFRSVLKLLQLVIMYLSLFSAIFM